MRILILCLLALAGCTTSRIEKPYTKEVTVSKDGTTTTKETSADSITGGSIDSLKKAK
jgi:hypothetical protein